MKQKNVIIVAVAVGCGLVAAFLVVTIKPSQADPGVKVFVAKKDLPVFTKMGKDSLDDYIEEKTVSKDSIVGGIAPSKEQLADKRILRNYRAGEMFNPADLSSANSINPPAGFDMMAFPATVEKAVAGFAGPGSKVNVYASMPSTRKNGEVDTIPIFIDMLVLAIDQGTQYPQAGQAFNSLSTVSVAVTKQQARLLSTAIARNASLRLLLLNPDGNSKPDEKVYSHQEILAFLNDSVKDTSEGQIPVAPTPPKTLAKLPIATKPLAPGTQLTQELIDSLGSLEMEKPPVGMLTFSELKDLKDKYLTKELTTGQFVPKAFVGEKLVEVKPDPKPDTTVAATAPMPKEPEPTYAKPSPEGLAGAVEKPGSLPVKKAPVYYDQSIQTPNGVKWFRYEVMEDGTYKLTNLERPNESTKPTPPESGKAI